MIPDTPEAPTIRPAREDDLTETQLIVNLAFAKQFNLPSVAAFGDRMTVAPRWHADRESVLVAELDGRLVGSNVVTTWGSFGWFGPLTVHPDFWNGGIARALLDVTMERFVERGTTVEALYTFASSPKHVALYQRYGFWPRRLTAVLTRAPQPATLPYRRFSALTPAEQTQTLRALAAITTELLPGLDVSREIASMVQAKLGDVVIVDDARGSVAGFAVVHRGAGSEAGSGAASVKFGAAVAQAPFRDLLTAVLAYGADEGVERVVVTINAAREGAYRAALDAGFTIGLLGVAMVRGGAAYDHPDAWVIEDHR